MLLLTLIFATAGSLWAYKILYAEQFYRLYHRHFSQYPEDCAENIYYLEKALERPFVNPLNAMARIEDEKEWERYRLLFTMHVNIKLTEQYRILASKFDKRKAYFFNAPWKETNLKSLQMAEKYYRNALYYWNETLKWVAALDEIPYYHLDEIEYWEDELFRIKTGDLDYKRYIEADLKRLEGVRDSFEAMDESTY